MIHESLSHPLSRRTLLLGTAAALVTGCTKAPAPTPGGSSSTGAIEFVDGVGRTIKLERPVQRAVVVSRYTNELIRAIGSIDKVVQVDMNTAQDRVYWAQFDPKEVIGDSKGLNYEQILKLAPDALIEGNQEALDRDSAKLGPAGITCIGVVPWDQAHFQQQIRVLGQAFGNEAGAERVVTWFDENMKMVADRVAALPKKTVYWEYGDPFTTCIPGTSNQGWHDMIGSAGGTNIFGDPNLAGKKIDPEKVLAANPDVIIKTTSGKALKNTGIYTPPTEAEWQEIGDEMLSRPGWKDLKAVKEGKVFCTTGFAGGGLGKMVGTVFTASWLHPEAMAGIDPEAVFAEWMKMQGMPPIPGHNYRVPKP